MESEELIAIILGEKERITMMTSEEVNALIASIGMVRALRLAVVQNVYNQGALSEDEAREILRGCLTPGNEATRVDDGDLLEVKR